MWVWIERWVQINRAVGQRSIQDARKHRIISSAIGYRVCALALFPWPFQSITRINTTVFRSIDALTRASHGLSIDCAAQLIGRPSNSHSNQNTYFNSLIQSLFHQQINTTQARSMAEAAGAAEGGPTVLVVGAGYVRSYGWLRSRPGCVSNTNVPAQTQQPRGPGLCHRMPPLRAARAGR